jgi:hypothetical protein
MQGTVDPVTANAMARSVLLQTGVKMSQIVFQGSSLLSIGGTPTRFDLLRVGITTGVMLDFTLSLNVSAAMTASAAGPWPTIQQLRYTDFSGVDRVNTDALSLFVMNTFKHNELFGNAVPGEVAAIGVVDTNILTHPTGTGATVLVFFSCYVPMAYDARSDLRGAVPAMVNTGQHYLTITPAAALTSSTDPTAAPYTAGTATVNSLLVDITQFYIQPQNLSPQTLPGIDLTTIYEINGRNITTSGFQSNSVNLINYPNDRSVMSAIHVFVNGGALTANQVDVTKTELLVNSNTTVRQMTPRLFRALMRMIARADVPSGIYYWPHRDQPVLTSLFATVQARYTLGTINAGTTKITAQYESFYPSGQPLSGIATNAG